MTPLVAVALLAGAEEAPLPRRVRQMEGAKAAAATPASHVWQPTAPGQAVDLGRGGGGEPVWMPRLGFGCASNIHQRELVAALTAGYRLFDTAQSAQWGYDEPALASALAQTGVPREEVFIASKISPYEMLDAAAACEGIVSRLGVDYLDLLLLHWPGVAKAKLTSEKNGEARATAWAALEALHERGVARSIGVSNFEVEHLRQMRAAGARIMPHVNQVEVHPEFPNAELRAACAAEDVAVVAYASLGVGDLLEDATVRRVAEGVGRTPAQVLLRWGLQQGLCVLPKSGDPPRIAANGAVFDFELPADAMRALDGLAGQGGGKRCWDPRGVR